MRFFFRSRQLKIILAVFASIVILSAVFAFIGFKIAPQANIAGTLAAPFQSLVATVKNSVSDFISVYNNGNELLIENQELKSEVNELREKLAEYNTAMEQNEFYEQYLGNEKRIKEHAGSVRYFISNNSGSCITNIEGFNSKTDKKKFKTVGIVIGLVVFLTSGGVMVAQKLMGLYFAGQSIGAYNFYSFIVAFFILCFFAKSKNIDKKSKKAVLICSMGSAVSLSIISIVMTKMAGSVPSVVLFPLFNGLGIIFVCVGSVFVFKEKLSIKNVVGLLLGVCGLCLVNL